MIVLIKTGDINGEGYLIETFRTNRYTTIVNKILSRVMMFTLFGSLPSLDQDL